MDKKSKQPIEPSGSSEQQQVTNQINPKNLTTTRTPDSIDELQQKRKWTKFRIIKYIILTFLGLFFGSAFIVATYDAAREEFGLGDSGSSKNNMISDGRFSNDCFGFLATNLKIKSDSTKAIKPCDVELLRSNNETSSSYEVLVYEKMTGGFEAAVDANTNVPGYTVTKTKRQVDGAEAYLLNFKPIDPEIYPTDRFMLFINSKYKNVRAAGKDYIGVSVAGDFISEADQTTLNQIISSWQWK